MVSVLPTSTFPGSMAVDWNSQSAYPDTDLEYAAAQG